MRAFRRPQTSADTVGDLPREVAVLSAVAFAVAVGFGIAAPAIPLFAREFGAGRTAAGAVISAFAFMRLVSALMGGRLVDRFGERLVLATGLGIVALSSALAGTAQSYAQLLTLRAAGGVGSAMFTVSAVSLLLRVSPPHLRGRATGVYQSGFLVGGVAGPAFGGYLASVSLRLPFFVYAGTLTVAGVVAMVFLARTPLADARKPAAGDAQPTTGLRTALRNRAYLAALVTNLGTGWALFGVRSALVPLFVVESLHRDPVWVGSGLVLSAAAQMAALLPAGRLVDQIGRRPGMVTGATLGALALGLLALAASLPVYLAAMAVLGLGAAFLGTAPSAAVGDVVSGRGGTVVATFQMASDLGAVTGPLVAGLLVDEVSYGAAWGVSAGVLATGALLAATAPETRTRTRPVVS